MPKGIYTRKTETRFCDIENCVRVHYGRGFCHMHYKRDEARRKVYAYKHENRIQIYENHAEVIIENKSREEFGRACVDLDDVDMIRSFKWCEASGGYAVTNYYGTMIRMHNMIMGRVFIDHINCNRLDNRKNNLRPASYYQNNSRAPRKKTKYKYRGVYKKINRHIAWITSGGHKNYIGSFKTAEEAAYAYDQFAMQMFGDFSLTNFEYI